MTFSVFLMGKIKSQIIRIDLQKKVQNSSLSLLLRNYSFSERDSLLGTPASCRQLIERQPIAAGKMLVLPGNIYLKCYRSTHQLSSHHTMVSVLACKAWILYKPDLSLSPIDHYCRKLRGFLIPFTKISPNAR